MARRVAGSATVKAASETAAARVGPTAKFAGEVGPFTSQQPGDERLKAWQRLADEVERAGFVRPEVRWMPVALEHSKLACESLSHADLRQRLHDSASLIQEAEWFLKDLHLSLSDVPHFVVLRDADHWILDVRGDAKSLASLSRRGFAAGSRGVTGGSRGLASWTVHPPSRRDAPPTINLFPEVQAGRPGWTVIALGLRRPPEGVAGSIVVGYCDRRAATRIFSLLYSSAAAIERQMLWSDRLAQADRLSIVGTMISQIVHEVKNPLAAMKAALQLAKHSDGLEREECLQLLHKEIDELNTLVENLLSLAKPAPPRFELQCLEVLVAEVLGLVRYEANLRMVHVDFRPGRTASFLRCDAHLLKQAFLNLARNAIQAMPHGGVLSLTIRRRSAKAGVAIEVADTGIGIPSEHLPHLFEPFFTTKEIGGTGLGLAVTRRIIEEVHVGQIRVESVPGAGTRFQVFLPFNPEPL